MANNLRVVAHQQGVSRASEGTFVGLRGTRDGSFYSIDPLLAASLEGRMFIAQLGSASTPSAAMDAYNADQPEMAVDVPDGTAIIPVSIHVDIQTHGATLNETIALASRTPVELDGNVTAITINPVRTDNPGPGSSCSAIGTITGNQTDPNTTGSFEFWRSGSPVDFDVAGEPVPTLVLSAKRFVPPLIAGPGSLVIYCSGTAPVGFITVVWMEFPESVLA